MKYYIILSFFLLVTAGLTAQKSYDIENRKGGLFLKVSPEYRITPIYDSEFIKRDGFPRNIDQSNSSAALSYAFDYFITKNWSLGFSHSLRYDVFLAGIDDIEGDFGAQPDNKTLIQDFHIYADYHFKIFKEGEIFARVGYSRMNTGTFFSEKTTFFEENGEDTGISSFSSVADFSYFAYNLSLGYKKNRIELAGGIYSSSVTEYFDATTRFILPYFKLSYNIGKL
ncbi:hypothetical protein DCS32_06870 [Dokdonia sp. Dokd-P16]|uniref:hypothetical protein n=1 Tax=Dokdonia sp. Dokd-P16 TaxID=2173169 RepID=UPI000D545214|nr:hypothetical protein [Dokdonia sp. Dokd-P16]AWH73886.1 hypothetical protein DCS32_06870 [Dokdonia sp. Dokd-P16]